MKKFIVLMIGMFGGYVLAQSASPVPTVVAPASSGSLSAIIAAVVPIVLCLNIALSAIQQIFSQLSKSEPGLLQQISSIVTKVANYLGSNPQLK